MILKKLMLPSFTAQSSSPNREKVLRISLWAVSLVLGFIQAWTHRFSMNPDGISYLDLGDAYFRGDWDNAINVHYSPLYSWIVSSGLHLLHPSMYWEFPVVHLVNFFIYTCTVASFHFFLMQTIQWNRNQPNPSSSFIVLSNSAWLILGYAIFLWFSLVFITVKTEHPDMIAAALLILAMGIILLICNGKTSLSNFLLLGVILGFGYLSRTQLFFIALLLLGIVYFSIRKIDKSAMLVLAAAITFLCISGPFIFAISKSKGRFTIGESGRLNYIWKVNKIPHFYHYQGAPGLDKPIHPTRKILDDPPIYEFGTPIGGTYPPWYDPAYWYEGVKVHFNFRQQLSRLVVSLQIYLSSIFDTHVPFTSYLYYGPDVLIVCYLILFFMSQRARLVFRDFLERKVILLPAIVGLGMYAVLWINPRYLAVYFVLLWVGVFSSLRLPDTKESKRLSASVCCAAFLVMFMTIAVPLTFNFYSDIRELMEGKADFVQAQVAEGLKKMGIGPGTKIATIGYAFGDYAFSARLGRLKIISEIDFSDEDRFWHADSSVRSLVYRKFAETGAKVVLSKDIPPLILADGWEKIDNTNYYVYVLSKGPN
jgi:hypothetical protein